MVTETTDASLDHDILSAIFLQFICRRRRAMYRCLYARGNSVEFVSSCLSLKITTASLLMIIIMGIVKVNGS